MRLGLRAFVAHRSRCRSRDELDHPHRGLLDGEVGDVEHGAAEPPVDRATPPRAPRRRRAGRRSASAGRPSSATRSARISESRSASIVSPTIFAGSISNSVGGGSIPFTIGHVRRLVAEVAEVDRERRLRRARDADEDDVGLVEPAADAVVVLDRELDRLDALEVRLVERRPGARASSAQRPPRRGRSSRSGGRAGRSSARGRAGTAGASRRAARARRACRPSPPGGLARGCDREREIVDRLDARMPDLARTPAPGTAPRARGRAAPPSRPSSPRRCGARPARPSTSAAG